MSSFQRRKTSSPTSVLSDDEDKYHKRIHRPQKIVPRLSWTTFCGIFSFLLVVFLWRLSADSAYDEDYYQQKSRWQRAKLMHRQRLGKRNKPPPKNADEISTEELNQRFQQLNHDILGNVKGGPRFLVPKLLPPLPSDPQNKLSFMEEHRLHKKISHEYIGQHDPFRVSRRRSTFEWKNEEWDESKGPQVDYTQPSLYQYPPILNEPPKNGGYPKLKRLGDLLKHWPQNELDHPPTPLVEELIHFNFSDPNEREAALKFRKAELPFKLYDVPEVTKAGIKWTDDYVGSNFDESRGLFSSAPPRTKGNAQESLNHFFAFYTPPNWNVRTQGIPPVRNNDITFKEWARHARYADSVGLSPDRPHFYWQCGVPREERLSAESKWTFVSRDLPSFSSPTETFFVFNPTEQKGIQCRFGERGVTAATHYDAGRNMVAMVTGAKRYILSPPKACSRLGIVTQRGDAIFRHSLLNFAHFEELDNAEMSDKERAWLERAKDSMAVDTVVKAGEVLYIPSHWFHYITSVQKSAQCNVRSGVDLDGTAEFGGADDVYDCDADP